MNYKIPEEELLTDLYQLTMIYAHWKSGRHNEPAVFEQFVRKMPYGGEFMVFAGLEKIINFIANFKISSRAIAYLQNIAMPNCEPEFFKWLKTLNFSEVRVCAPKEGTVVFSRFPLLRVEGPLAAAQFLETRSLNAINFASLVATNAARMRLAAGWDKLLFEFGLRRAQGSDGGLSASKYSYMGGFDGTSNVLAGMLCGIPASGTMAHSYIQSHKSLKDLKHRMLKGLDGKEYDFVDLALEMRNKLNLRLTNEGELAAFISYAMAFPNKFLALVDTYSTMGSGVPNFICVAAALAKIGYKPIGVRFDSGDLAKLSKETRTLLKSIQLPFAAEYALGNAALLGSNDISEAVLHELNKQNHELNGFGIGTMLATCYAQPALNGVYKLVEINGQPSIKLSEDTDEAGKVTLPGAKEAYRIFGPDGFPLLDILTLRGETPPQRGKPFACRDPFKETKRAVVTPSKAKHLNELVWDSGKIVRTLPSISEIRKSVIEQLKNLQAKSLKNDDHLRAQNPTPYKVYVSNKLHALLHDLMTKEARVAEIS